LGAAYERAGQLAKARTMYQEALKLDPKLEDARKNLQRIANR
jgi:Flp pilus assembly protein TadD